MWYVYILECKNRTLYTGITKNITRRIKEHKKGKGARYTRAFKVKKLIYKKACPTRSSALKCEARIKKLTRKKKLEMASGIRK
ncbi:MAG: GIY-YIG nuclease family protein [Endomicrobiales bacterium]|nr:GIY-YIG nuclease family protein [Endomicrobiales bacterium]